MGSARNGDPGRGRPIRVTGPPRRLRPGRGVVRLALLLAPLLLLGMWWAVHPPGPSGGSSRGAIIVATTGSDSTGSGTAQAPLATLAAALAMSGPGDQIVVRGGTYPIDGEVVLDRAGVRISAYPGERPVFDGSLPALGTGSEQGRLLRIGYRPVPASPGQGLTPADLPAARFDAGEPVGLAGSRGWRCVDARGYTAPRRRLGGSDGCPARSQARVITGYYPDQAWVDGMALTQVLDESLVVPGTFFVERSAGTDARPSPGSLVLHRADGADLSRVRVSGSSGTFLRIVAAGVEVSGLTITRHSPDWANAVITIGPRATGTVLRDLRLRANASIGIKIAGSWRTGLVRATTLDGVVVDRSGWSGLVSTYSDDTSIIRSAFTGTDPAGEFAGSPQRGSIKATKNHRMRIVDSWFADSTSFGVWWDQSNYDVTLADSRFERNGESAVFFEISHGLLVADTLIDARGSMGPAVRLAGSSGIRVVNNTILGGQGGIAVLTDARSRDYVPGRPCAEHPVRYGQPGDLGRCSIVYASDLDRARPGAFGSDGGGGLTPELTWRPRVDLLLNNVIADTAPDGFCARAAPLCVRSYTRWTGRLTEVPVESIVGAHTLMDGNVYQSAPTVAVLQVPPGGRGRVIATSLEDLRGSRGLAGEPYLVGAEEHGRSGPGWVDPAGAPTTLLTSVQGTAAPVPVDPRINEFVPAGSRDFGSSRAPRGAT